MSKPMTDEFVEETKPSIEEPTEPASALRFDKAPIYRCVICGNEYSAKGRDADWNWKMPDLIEWVDYNGERQLRCIPKIHEELLYGLAKPFEPIPPPEPRAPDETIDEAE